MSLLQKEKVLNKKTKQKINMLNYFMFQLQNKQTNKKKPTTILIK